MNLENGIKTKENLGIPRQSVYSIISPAAGCGNTGCLLTYIFTSQWKFELKNISLGTILGITTTFH